MNVGRAMREIAEEKGMRQVDICRASGLSDAHITQLWHGKISDPSAWIAYRVAHAMDTTVDELIERAKKYE